MIFTHYSDILKKSKKMSTLVTSTADILAILGGATTFVAAVFAAVRLSRCQTVSCCWGALNLVNKPIPVPIQPPPPPQSIERDNSVAV